MWTTLTLKDHAAATLLVCATERRGTAVRAADLQCLAVQPLAAYCTTLAAVTTPQAAWARAIILTWSALAIRSARRHLCTIDAPRLLRREAVHLPLDDVVEDVVDGRVGVAQAALRRAHGLQPVLCNHLVDGRGDLTRRHLVRGRLGVGSMRIR